MADTIPTKSDIFCSPTADLVLRSADDVDFCVHKLILATSSPFFDDMSRLPQPATASADPSAAPVATMAETSRTLDILLHLVYPDKHPAPFSLLELGRVLKAADKYDMDGVVGQLRQLLGLPMYVQAEPYRVFALACQYDLGDELIKRAAKNTLQCQLPHLTYPLTAPPELVDLSALQYHSLLTYRDRCLSALATMLYDTARNKGALPPSQAPISIQPIWVTCSCAAVSGVTDWFRYYVENTLASLRSGITVEAIRSVARVECTLTKIPPRCKLCATDGARDLLRFIDAAAAKMEETVVRVEFSSMKVEQI
ncbi:hypothetical protein PHLGIDRAFT_122607 [Phlebiopsis gigantea 11061_1 CR5-6]|uniref:BTB domain-containing protein n=1 Tax=Phlebiopsis gigantea (strain 11061_1 CR5-6) TaxID=745531 RepID=A0A0C3NCK6_PHLG1|nr:hypothetical protein PHLGIDRAFT_122607 [Phlebiopsis gigantea 11061_1 CR5-6]